MFLNRKLLLIYLTGFLLAVHFASVTYVNSSLLKKFAEDGLVSMLYVAASVLGVMLLLLMPRLLRRFGSVHIFAAFIALEIISVFGMGGLNSASAVTLLFLLHIAVDSALLLCLDINLEQETRAEGMTGRVRGILFAVANTAWVLSPLALVFLVNQDSFGKVYLLSGLALVPLLIIVTFFFKNAERATASESNVKTSVLSLFRGGDKARIIFIQFILNFFYAWMVIYLPLLLSKEIGFGWNEIGFVFMFMLLPFLLLELPAGILIDKRFGEREFLAAGLVFMFVFTFLIPFMGRPLFWIWAAVLFATRVGASLVEISTESYFFKHVQEENTGLISLFRIARPFSYVIAPLLAFPAVFFFSYSASFFFLAAFPLLALFFIPKKDTK